LDAEQQQNPQQHSQLPSIGSAKTTRLRTGDLPAIRLFGKVAQSPLEDAKLSICCDALGIDCRAGEALQEDAKLSICCDALGIDCSAGEALKDCDVFCTQDFEFEKEKLLRKGDVPANRTFDKAARSPWEDARLSICCDALGSDSRAGKALQDCNVFCSQDFESEKGTCLRKGDVPANRTFGVARSPWEDPKLSICCGSLGIENLATGGLQDCDLFCSQAIKFGYKPEPPFVSIAELECAFNGETERFLRAANR